jgi:hypothetical protein
MSWLGRWRSCCPLVLAEQRTLNPRVRGSSPWQRTRSDLGFYHPRPFFSCPFCPHVCSMFARAHGPSNPGLVKNGPSSPGCGGMRPGSAPSRTADVALHSLDQWSRPYAPTLRARPESAMPMPSDSVKSAVNGTRMVDTSLALAPWAPWLPAGDARDSGKVLPGRGAGSGRRSKQQVRWALPSVRA